jgi:hypothetical protein
MGRSVALAKIWKLGTVISILFLCFNERFGGENRGKGSFSGMTTAVEKIDRH